jgi:hypothetical protein
MLPIGRGFRSLMRGKLENDRMAPKGVASQMAMKRQIKNEIRSTPKTKQNMIWRGL